MRLLKLSIMRVSFFCMSGAGSRSSLIRRSILLMYRTGRTRSFSACRVTVSVWTMISSTASTTMMAPSVALRARVTFPVKSTCPGVSIKLMT